MKRILTYIFCLNIIYSIYLVIYKTLIDCKTCSHLPVKLPVSPTQLAFLALAASIILLTLFRLSSKSSAYWFAYRGFLFFAVFISSTLMAIQYKVGYIVCLQCFISEILFYITFVVAILPTLFPWIHRKWDS